MADRSYNQLVSSFPDNSTGLIGPGDLRALTAAQRPSVATEAFRPSDAADGYSIPVSGWDNSAMPSTSADPPAWFWVRSDTYLPSGGSNPQALSHVDGLLDITTASGDGYTYDAGNTSETMRAFMLTGSIRGKTDSGGSLRGALAFYNGTTWTSAAQPVAKFPFDTGDTSPRPYYASGFQVVLMNPGDTLFVRLEAYGPSVAGGSASTAFYVDYFQVDLIGLSPFQPPGDANAGEIPASQTREQFADLHAELTWPSGNVDLDDGELPVT